MYYVVLLFSILLASAGSTLAMKGKGEIIMQNYEDAFFRNNIYNNGKEVLDGLDMNLRRFLGEDDVSYEQFIRNVTTIFSQYGFTRDACAQYAKQHPALPVQQYYMQWGLLVTGLLCTGAIIGGLIMHTKIYRKPLTYLQTLLKKFRRRKSKQVQQLLIIEKLANMRPNGRIL